MNYDLVIGGAGLYGATLAHFAHKKGLKVLVIEKSEIGGLCADPDNYPKYGPHLFHTNDRTLWEWVNTIDHFIPIHYSPLVQYKDELYSFPINKLTLHQLGYDGPIRKPKGRNFEEACLYAVGPVIYEKFYYHYTKKMWGRDPSVLPVSLLNRVPVRSDYRTSYYSDRYVGVPVNGYTYFITRLLKGVEVKEGDFCQEHFKAKQVFTGSIDEYHGYKLGMLPYRGLWFTKVKSIDAMTIHYTDDRPYLREVNYSYMGYRNITIREYPSWHPCNPPFEDGYKDQMYPVPWGVDLYNEYKALKTDVEFAGRLGSYKYLNMNEIIEQAHKKSKAL